MFHILPHRLEFHFGPPSGGETKYKFIIDLQHWGLMLHLPEDRFVRTQLSFLCFHFNMKLGGKHRKHPHWYILDNNPYRKKDPEGHYFAFGVCYSQLGLFDIQWSKFSNGHYRFITHIFCFDFIWIRGLSYKDRFVDRL